MKSFYESIMIGYFNLAGRSKNKEISAIPGGKFIFTLIENCVLSRNKIF